MNHFIHRTICLAALSVLFLCTAFVTPTFAQPGGGQPTGVQMGNPNWEYARMITLESMIAGGAGRSRMFIITPDGKKQEADLKNYYSLTGINFSNIYENEEKKALALNELSKAGWEVYWIETGNQDGIYTTKYLLRRSRQ
ncbi:hypothetical protein [Rhodoflexus sp.]